MKIPELLKSYLEHPVGVLGNGVSGRAVVGMLERLGVSYGVYDEGGGDGVRGVFEEGDAGRHRLVVYSPGFRRDHAWLELARRHGCVCLGELDFGSLFWKGKMIAVTGTNGKSTLTCLLASAFQALGKKALACGNVGSALSAQYEYFDDEEAIAVCEVSSFQAETVNYFVPDGIIWTSFDEDHLDRHADMRAYFEAKWNLVKQLRTQELYIGGTVLKAIKEYGYEMPLGTSVVDVEDLDNKELFLEGMFGVLPQLENYLLGLAYWEGQGLDGEVFRGAARAFRPLPHRLRKVGEVGGVGFWNDAKGTNFSAAIAAVRGFDKKVFWIGGGKMKGGDQRGFAERISPYVEEAFLIGESAVILEEGFKELGVRVERFCSLQEAVEAAYGRALMAGGGEVVLSPGYASFDMFRNAEERGQVFEKKVLELKNLKFVI